MAILIKTFREAYDAFLQGLNSIEPGCQVDLAYSQTSKQATGMVFVANTRKEGMANNNVDELLEIYTRTFSEVARYSIQMQYKWVKYGAFITGLPYEDAKI